MSSNRKFTWWVIGLIAVVIVVALGALINLNTKETLPKKQVALRLLWLNQAQFAGVYSAINEGFYRDANLDMTVVPGGPGINPIRMVASGSEDIGICLGPDIILAREKNIPVRALAIIVRKNPTCYFAKADSGITSVEDFRGKKIGVKVGFPIEYYLTAMLRNAGIDESAIDRVPVQFDMARFFNGEIDVWCGLRINEPNVARQKGVEVNEILPSDYGVDVVGEVIFTSEDFYAKNQDVCWAFVKATWKGWQFARDNRAKAVSHVLQFSAKANTTHEAVMLDSILPLIFVNGRDNPFDQNEEIWQRMIDFLMESKVLEKSVPPSECFWKHK